MRQFLVWTMAAALTAACGSAPEEEQAAQQVEKAADEVQDSAKQMARGLEDMAKGLSSLTGADPNAKPVDPVSFRELQTVMPDFAGWEKGKPTGERMSSPVSFSQAEVTYTKGDAEIEQSVIDSALNQMLVAPYAMFLTSGYEKETQTGYEKSVKVLGEYPGWETWDTDGKRGELNAIVNQRFIVRVEGRGIDDTKVLHQLMQSTDLKKLAGLK